MNMDRLIGQMQYDCEHRWKTHYAKGKPFLERCNKCEAQRPVGFVGRREGKRRRAGNFLGKEAS